MFSSASAFLPGKPVAVGDEWNWDLAVTAPFPMDLKSRYRLAAIGAEVVRIEVRGTVAPGPGDGILEMGPMRMKVELEGTQSGWFEMDRATGWTLKGEIDQDMKGTMIMLAPHGDGEDVEVPMSIRSKMKFMPAK